jgi:multidrug efflux pump subunit AcrA (membrane-fusion protein)
VRRLLVLLAACTHGSGDLQLVEVRKDDLVLGVDVVGELEAVDSMDIKPPALGHVWDYKIAMLAPEGQDVKQGDPVIGFDPSEQIHELENMQNEAEAAEKKLEKKRDDAALARRDDGLKVSQAEADLKKAKLKADAPADLSSAIALKELQLDAQNAELGLEAARHHAEQAKRSDEAELKQLAEKAEYAKHRADELKETVGKMRVTAPRAGTIVYPMGWRGDKHKVGDSVSRMEAVMQIVGLGQMVARGRVDEVDMARVADKQPVSVRLDAQPDVVLRGHVKEIAHSMHARSETDPSKVVHLTIDLDPTKVTLRPGMRFRGQVETDKLPGVVQVPAEAVFVHAEGPVAYRESGGALEKVNLVLGRRSSTAIEVKSGLAAGDKVSRVDPESAW